MSLKKKNTKPTKSPLTLDEKKKHAIETYQEYEEDMLTSEEQNSKTPIVLAFIAALSLIVLSVVAFSFFTPDSSSDLASEPINSQKYECSTQEMNPVCAHNGKTYKNACLAEEAKVTISHLGACLDPETPTLSWVSISSGNESPMTSSASIVGTGMVTQDLLSDSDATMMIASGSQIMTGASEEASSNDTSTIQSVRSFTGKTHFFRQPKLKYSVEIPFSYYYSSLSSEKWVLHTLVIAKTAGETSSEKTALVNMKVYDIKSEWSIEPNPSAIKIKKDDKIFMITPIDSSSDAKTIVDLLTQTLKYPN